MSGPKLNLNARFRRKIRETKVLASSRLFTFGQRSKGRLVVPAPQEQVRNVRTIQNTVLPNRKAVLCEKRADRECHRKQTATVAYEVFASTFTVVRNLTLVSHRVRGSVFSSTYEHGSISRAAVGSTAAVVEV